MQQVPGLLLVEGVDDKEALFQFFNATQIDNRAHFDVAAKHGVEEALKSFRVELKGARYQRLALIVDADLDAQRTWTRVRSILTTAGYPRVPEDVPPHGIALPPFNAFAPSVGVWVMPGQAAPGAMEDFLSTLVPADDPLLAHADRTLDQLPEQRFKPVHRSKALLHTWLAWQEEPGTRPGLAFKRSYFRHDAPLAEALTRWLRNALIDEVTAGEVATP